MTVKFPSIKDVARGLRQLNNSVFTEDLEEGVDVRLQVRECGWWLHWGDSQYYQDHRGFWGCGIIPGCFKGRPRRFNSCDVARDLISQARDGYAEYQAAEALAEWLDDK